MSDNGSKGPLVSIILCVRNGEDYLRESIESVLGQSYTSWELIVIDGGSEDESAAIARSYPGVRCIPQTGTGIPNAYNQGVATANGDLLAWISHDDIWLPEKLIQQVAAMQDNPAAAYCNCHVQHFLQPGSEIPLGFRPELLESHQPAFIMETLLARRSAFEQVGLFDESYVVAEDVDWFSRARAIDLPYIMLPSTLVRKRVHGSNASLTTPDHDKLMMRLVKASLERKKRPPGSP